MLTLVLFYTALFDTSLSIFVSPPSAYSCLQLGPESSCTFVSCSIVPSVNVQIKVSPECVAADCGSGTGVPFCPSDLLWGGSLPHAQYSGLCAVLLQGKPLSRCKVLVSCWPLLTVRPANNDALSAKERIQRVNYNAAKKCSSLLGNCL